MDTENSNWSLFLKGFCNNSFHSADLQSSVKKGKMSREKFEKTLSLLNGVLDYESFEDVDMVIEVVQNAYHCCLFRKWVKKIFSICC